MRAIALKTEWMRDPVGIDVREPLLTWLCQGGERQTAYEIRALHDGVELWDSGRVEGADMRAFFGAALGSRDRVCWRVRLWDENGEAGPWSDEAVFEMGLLERGDFKAKWIDPEMGRDPDEHKPASYLRKSFYLDSQPGGARLYVTCHGLYEVWLNGERVGRDVLTPGTSTYDRRLFVQTYDVGPLLRAGENEALVILGDGWYRSCSGVDGERDLYGEDVALWFQLEAGGEIVCASDESWEATQLGPIRMDDMQQGEVVDARLWPLTGWHGVTVRDFGTENLCASNCVPIREHERFTGELITTPNGERVLDFGQNLAGYIQFTLRARAGETLKLMCGEALDENGNFTQENFQERSRHLEGGTRQEVIYTCREGVNHYKTKFSIWGFRYARVETDMDLSGAEFTAIAVYSDMERTGWFECGNEDVNRLVENTVWSMKSNFCDVPTDCPTRERAAWTGDMGVFIDTGLYLMDCESVVRKWLGECRICQYPDGKVANIAPKNNRPTFTTELLAGSVGWGDASIIMPRALYGRFGDSRVLWENFDMMRRWYGYLGTRTGGGQGSIHLDMDALPEQYRSALERMPPEELAKLLEKFAGGRQQGDDPYGEYTIRSGTDYGEWCEPDTDSVALMKTVQSGIATAYYAYSGALLAEIAGVRSHRRGNIGPALIDIKRSMTEWRGYMGVDLSDPEDKWVYYSPMSWHPDSTRAMWNERTRLCEGPVRCRLRVCRLLDVPPTEPVPAARKPDSGEIPYSEPMSAALTTQNISFPLTVTGKTGTVTALPVEGGAWGTRWERFSEDGETFYDGWLRVKAPDNMFRPGETTIKSDLTVSSAHTGRMDLRVTFRADERFQIYPDTGAHGDGRTKCFGYAEYDGLRRYVAELAP